MSTLLRIEAINLAFVIDDTEDLSTRRGGSYMLLDAVNQLKNHFSDRLKAISTGASVGLFELLPAAGDGRQLRDEVRQFLQASEKPYAHATFTVDLVQDDDFRTASEKAVAANRWRQMHELNFSTAWGESSEVCGIDEIRPGIEKIHLPDNKTVMVSASVHARREAGRDLRQDIYRDILDESLSLQFTDDTKSLSTFQTSAFPEIPANLNGKMAVFYADGNGFGRIQRDCQDAAALKKWDKDIRDKRKKLLKALLELKKWDKDIRDKRKKLLKALLDWLEQTPWARTDTGELRFETLLWGGDELLFLLPAWLGLQFAEQFFALTADWAYGAEKLTHACGLVFAKHSTPISQLQTLAKQLAEHGKTETRKEQNSLSWVVLESFDHTGDQIDKFWERNGIPENGWDRLLLTAERLADLRAMEPLKEALPRSALVRALRSIATGQQADEYKLLQGTYRSTEQSLTQEQQAALARLWQAFDSQWQSQLPAKDKTGPEAQELSEWAAKEAVPWTALLELWDYLLPNAPTADAGEIAA
jgi:hypothetical protein